MKRYFILALGALFLLAGCGGSAPAASWYGIAVGDDTVYLSANQQVFALNLESGAELWAFPPEPDSAVGSFYAPPLLRDEVLVVGSFDVDGKLYGILRDDGTQNWVTDVEGRIIEGATATDGGVVVGTDEGEVYFVDLETQEKHLLMAADEAIWSTPWVDQDTGRAYITSMDHHLYALDLASGEELWRFEAGGAIAGAPAVSDRAVFVGALNSKFYAVDIETGSELWSVDTGGWVWGGPQVQDDTVYFGDLAGNLYALDTATGAERWVFEAEGGIRAAPLLADGVLYIGTRKHKVYAVNADDGVQKWKVSVTGSILGQPMLHQGYLLITPHNAKAKLVALAPESGAELWSYPSQEE